MAAANDIFTAASLCVTADAEEAELLHRCCRAAEEKLRRLLLEGVELHDIYDTFVTAAGLLAAADFLGCKPGSQVTGFSAGPISVSKADESCAARLRQQAAMLMAPYCQDAFCFMGVRG